MLFIEHRLNDLDLSKSVEYAEVDVQVDSDSNSSRLICRHDPYGRLRLLDDYITGNDHIKGFFVDVKQNMCVGEYQRIMDAFGSKLLGLFDVPMPAAYFLSQSGSPFYGRLSEFELPGTLTTRYWLDPLTKWDGTIHNALLTMLAPDRKVVVACPTLHGRPQEEVERVWEVIKIWSETEGAPEIQGIVTKQVDACREFMNE